jgi:pimeloyl-ACP methyl ester carboxylesterase
VTAGLTATGVLIPSGGVRLVGDLVAVPGAAGTVVFAHGSGSSRLSPRNRHVAGRLREGGLSTVLVDLLDAAEAAEDVVTRRLRFDVPLLVDRLTDVVDWSRRHAGAGGLGLFGASTGAAAALAMAALHPERVDAVVCRGGRPDLAAELLGEVRAPTLLVVGGDDAAVLDLNREALGRLGGPCDLHVVPGATHLFPEPGALDTVAAVARDWFLAHLGARAIPTKEA